MYIFSFYVCKTLTITDISPIIYIGAATLYNNRKLYGYDGPIKCYLENTPKEYWKRLKIAPINDDILYRNKELMETILILLNKSGIWSNGFNMNLSVSLDKMEKIYKQLIKYSKKDARIGNLAKAMMVAYKKSMDWRLNINVPTNILAEFKKLKFQATKWYFCFTENRFYKLTKTKSQHILCKHARLSESCVIHGYKQKYQILNKRDSIKDGINRTFGVESLNKTTKYADGWDTFPIINIDPLVFDMSDNMIYDIKQMKMKNNEITGVE